MVFLNIAIMARAVPGKNKKSFSLPSIFVISTVVVDVNVVINVAAVFVK